MHQYNPSEAILEAWRKKLVQVAASEELLAIINDKQESDFRLQHFTKKMTDILQEDENRSWTWGGFISWLWSFISSLIPASWQKPTAPGLIETLREGVSIEEFAPLSDEDNPATATTILDDDNSYEQALFYAPQSAFADLKNRIDSLDEKSDINQILTRLHAIKYRLTVETYQKLLGKLFEQAPVQTLNFYYASYTKDPHETPSPHDFIEHELMSRTLMKIFVLPHAADSNSRLYALQELLLILSLSRQKQPPLRTLLNNAVSHQESPKLSLKLATQQILQLLPEEVAELGLKEPLHGVSRSPAFNQPLNLLKAVMAYPKRFGENDLQAQPLYQNLARLACQELLISYHQHPEIKSNTLLNSTIDFLAEEILGSAEAAKRERIKFRQAFGPNECEALLSPYALKARVPTEYERAIYYANQLIIACFFTSSLAERKESIIEKSREIAASIHKKPFQAHELAWLLDTAERMVANDPGFSCELKSILTSKHAPAKVDTKKSPAINAQVSSEESNVRQPDRLFAKNKGPTSRKEGKEDEEEHRNQIGP